MTPERLKQLRATCEADQQEWDEDRACPGCGRSIRLAEPDWMEPRGLCDVCVLEFRTAIPELLDEVEGLQKQLDDYHRAVAAQLHYDANSILTGTPEERACAALAAMTAARDEACDLADEANGDPSSCSYVVPLGERIAELRKVGAK